MHAVDTFRYTDDIRFIYDKCATSTPIYDTNLYTIVYTHSYITNAYIIRIYVVHIRQRALK